MWRAKLISLQLRVRGIFAMIVELVLSQSFEEKHKKHFESIFEIFLPRLV
jgi:hypothetical protein